MSSNEEDSPHPPPLAEHLNFPFLFVTPSLAGVTTARTLRTSIMRARRKPVDLVHHIFFFLPPYFFSFHLPLFLLLFFLSFFLFCFFFPSLSLSFAPPRVAGAPSKRPSRWTESAIAGRGASSGIGGPAKENASWVRRRMKY